MCLLVQDADLLVRLPIRVILFRAFPRYCLQRIRWRALICSIEPNYLEQFAIMSSLKKMCDDYIDSYHRFIHCISERHSIYTSEILRYAWNRILLYRQNIGCEFQKNWFNCINARVSTTVCSLLLKIFSQDFKRSDLKSRINTAKKSMKKIVPAQERTQKVRVILDFFGRRGLSRHCKCLNNSWAERRQNVPERQSL